MLPIGGKGGNRVNDIHIVNSSNKILHLLDLQNNHIMQHYCEHMTEMQPFQTSAKLSRKILATLVIIIITIIIINCMLNVNRSLMFLV